MIIVIPFLFLILGGAPRRGELLESVNNPTYFRIITICLLLSGIYINLLGVCVDFNIHLQNIKDNNKIIFNPIYSSPSVHYRHIVSGKHLDFIF